MTDKKRWLLTHDSHELKKGEIYEGDKLPAWLVGKAVPAVDSAGTAGGITQAQLTEALALNDVLTEERDALKAQLTEALAALEKANADLQAKQKKA